jgi:hypothetical protein
MGGQNQKNNKEGRKEGIILKTKRKRPVEDFLG